jgi:hypothetical protein
VLTSGSDSFSVSPAVVDESDTFIAEPPVGYDKVDTGEAPVASHVAVGSSGLAIVLLVGRGSVVYFLFLRREFGGAAVSKKILRLSVRHP